MKKRLMATSALVTAGLLGAASTAWAKPELTLGGRFEAIVGAVSDDAGKAGSPLPSHVSVDVHQDSEIFFSGSVTLDNGIKIRSRVELEAQSANSADQIDEAYINVSGSFGAIRIGSEDTVAHLMISPYQGSWAVQVGQNLHLDTTDWIESPPGHTASTSTRLALLFSDAEKITYFSPRIGGFQVGASYIPSYTEGDNGEPESTAENPHEGFSVGANYKGKFGDTGIGIGAGYTEVHEPAGVDQSRPKGWGVSAVVSAGPVKVAAGYTSRRNRSPETVTASPRGVDAIDVGASFQSGKNSYSVAWVRAEDNAGGPLGDRSDAAMLSYRRDLGPGVQYRLNLIYADFRGGVVGSSDDNQGVALTTAVFLSF